MTTRFPTARKVAQSLQILGKPIFVILLVICIIFFLIWIATYKLAGIINSWLVQIHTLQQDVKEYIKQIHRYSARKITLQISFPHLQALSSNNLLNRISIQINNQLKVNLTLFPTLIRRIVDKILCKVHPNQKFSLQALKLSTFHDFKCRLKKTTQQASSRYSVKQNLKKHYNYFQPRLVRLNIFTSARLRLPTKVHFSLKYFFIVVFCNLFLFSMAFLAINFYIYVFKDLPHPQQLLAYQAPATTKIFDRNGILLYQVYRDHNRIPVDIDQLPAYVLQAHLSIEDKDFYNHQGISLMGITRAIRQAWETGEFTSGGSTITQQLIKNILLTPDRTWPRKFKEGILALRTEKILTKHQILDLYLNNISYGGTAYGIEAASRQYFDKPAAQLSLAEAALLAGLPAAPSAYSPFGGQPETAIARQQQVLSRMAQDGYITWEEYQQALNERLQFSTPSNDIHAPHFVMYVRDQIESQLGPEKLARGGLNIETTLDLNLQHKAEELLNAELENLKRLNVTNGAILITKPATGEILAMVGSTDYFNTEAQGNYNATTALRQPGSSIKPLTYSAALSQHIPSPWRTTNSNHSKLYTAASLINDSPITYKIPGGEPYSPKNYDGKYHGRVTVRTALASSYNIPAVKTLDDIGISYLLEFAKQMGISTWDQPERYGLAITLGGAEVRMVDMATLYGVFANLGIKKDLNPILNITGLGMDNVPPSPFHDSQPSTLDPRVAFIINHILSDNDARVPAFGRNSKLNIPNQTVAVKTGTTNSMRDNWTIGYTPDYLVAVWVGNFDNTPMSRIASGITGATPIWHNVMKYLLTEYDPEAGKHAENNQFPWEPPEGLIKVAICPYTGTLPCNGCSTKEEWFIQGTQPTYHCSSIQPEQPENKDNNQSQPSSPEYDNMNNNRPWQRFRRQP